MTHITCPNCGYHYDPFEKHALDEDAIWLCQKRYDPVTDITALKFECTACGQYFQTLDSPLWEKPITQVLNRAAENDKRP